jgi:hypothetical protein
MDLREYMTKVRDALYDEKHLAQLHYSPKDKDSGYRSGLRFLGLAMTAETDAIANEMIYGTEYMAKRNKVKKIENGQMQLFA